LSFFWFTPNPKTFGSANFEFDIQCVEKELQVTNPDNQSDAAAHLSFSRIVALKNISTFLTI
jgi:hypothetical protein